MDNQKTPGLLRKVKSTSIAAMRYIDNVLTIRFTSGKWYKYEDVPACIFNTVFISNSIGSAFHKFIIKNSSVECYGLDEDEAKELEERYQAL